MPDSVPPAVLINLIVHDRKADDVTLVLVETERWSKDASTLLRLRAKLDGYVSFVISGQFARDYPALAGKRVRFRIDCHYPLRVKEVAFLYKYRSEELETRGIMLDMHEVGARSFLKRTFRKKY